MTAYIKRSGLLAFLTALIALSFVGCADKGTDKTSDDFKMAKSEVELFARAQELQKQEKFNEAVNIYRNITKKFKDTRQGANSQFMIGYIYANHIKDLEQAKIELDRFLGNFASVADSGLIEGAKFELSNLGKNIDDIPILSGLGDDEKGKPDTGKEK